MSFPEMAPAPKFTEEDVLKFTPKWRWLSLKVGPYQVFAMNWVTTLLASLILWIMVAVAIEDNDNFAETFNTGKTWFTQNFTWLYISSQDVWLVFLLWLTFSKYGSIKLGKDDEKPLYGDLSWFSMLFCCGIGVGFFVFGASEPLYYYRQPTTWKSWLYDYNINKPGFHDDDQRANQSIFVSFFHWGLHGWIPYITPTILLGVCSHRYGLPMGIRTCFYPLLGNQVFGLFGDIIDAISISCTTFGVCTSLGLGVMQIGAFYIRMAKDFSGDTVVLEDGDYSAIIVAITCFANISVILGIGRGLKTASYAAMVLAFLVLMPVFFADNSFYLLNVIVQSAGYYIQHFIQVGFDCEAFQMLGFEFQGEDGNNHFWGAGWDTLQGKLAGLDVASFGTPMAATPNIQMSSASLEIKTTSADCGFEPNPCNTGNITGAVAMVSMTYLTSMGLSAVDAARAYTIATSAAAGEYSWTSTNVPCGIANTTNLDATSAPMVGGKDGDDLPAGWTWPACPTTTFEETGSWGACSTNYYACYSQQAYFGSTNPNFMDWWTVFYWAWWISWAPFFGVFVGTVSRGRTIRQTVIGGFLAPLMLIMLWFGVFGGLVIKMERVAELALGVKPDWKHGTVECRGHYDGSGNPTSAEALALESVGYYMIACRATLDQFFDVLQPYQELAPFLMPVSFVALLVWFITSSDSGSYVDDLLASSGLSDPPVLQKVYWCWTEGACAIGLLVGGREAALKALRSASICAGFAENLFLCFFCTAIYRLVKFDAKDPDIMAAKKFNTQILDFLTGFKPIKTAYSAHPGYPHSPMTQGLNILIPLIFPGFSVFEIAGTLYSTISAALLATVSQSLWLAFIICHGIEDRTAGLFAIGWSMYFFFVLIIMMMRTHMRAKYAIWGSMAEDFWLAMTLPPFCLGQMKLQAANDGEGMRGYFEDLEELVAYHAKNPRAVTEATEVKAIEVAVTSATTE